MDNQGLITELLKSNQPINITVDFNFLRDFADYAINATRRELEAAVLADKAETYLSIKQVTEMLSVAPSTLWSWGKKGYLVNHEVGGKRRYKMSDVKKMLNGGSKTK